MSAFLLAHTYHLPLDPAEARLGRPYPPLGTLVSHAALEADGVDVALYDPTFSATVADFELALRGHQPRRVAIVPDPHAIPQKMCTRQLREAALAMVRLARAAGAEVCVTGPDASDHPEPYLHAGAQHVVQGEHDEAVRLFARGELVAGVVPRPASLPPLDHLPSPSWHAVDLARYAAAWRAQNDGWELNLSAARGCPYRCNWCAKPSWGRSYRVRPAAAVAREAADTFTMYQPDRIWFTDDIFGLRPSWLRAFREHLDGLRVPFRCLGRADLLADAAYVADLARAGCVEVWMGAESGSQAVLDAMDKDCTVDEIRRAAANLAAHGIRRGLFLQLGYPEETYTDVLATVRLVRELRPESIGVSVAYPLPGTPFYDRVRDRLRTESWATSMENVHLYDTVLGQPFYDDARELLRAEHALLRFGPTFAASTLWEAPGRLARAGWHAGRWPVHRARLALRARIATRKGQPS